MATFIQSREQQQQSSNLIVTVARDLASVLSLGILLICIHELATPFYRGFQCNDETIRYPYKDSTVSSGACYSVGTSLNILLILILEYFALVEGNSAHRDGTDAFPMKIYIRNVYCRLLVWLFGAITSELLTDISKFTAGRLRPHFISICQPKISFNEQKYTFEDYCNKTTDLYEYITEYECLGDPKKQRDARLSFLSGHSSYSAFSATFAVFYIQSAMDVAKFGLIKSSIQVLILAAAFYTGLTRVSDYKHHWQDVLAGLLLGTTVASTVHACVWTPFYNIYSKFLTSNKMNQPVQSGEELNRLSY